MLSEKMSSGINALLQHDSDMARDACQLDSKLTDMICYNKALTCMNVSKVRHE